MLLTDLAPRTGAAAIGSHNCAHEGACSESRKASCPLDDGAECASYLSMDTCRNLSATGFLCSVCDYRTREATALAWRRVEGGRVSASYRRFRFCPSCGAEVTI